MKLPPLLQRILRRTEAGGFAIWLLGDIERRGDSLTNRERRILEKCVEHIAGLEEDSHAMEERLRLEIVAHRSERLANIELARKSADLEERLKVAERQLTEWRAFVDSGEISLPDEDLFKE